MFIRRTRTNNKSTGEGYFTFRQVGGERIAGKVRQVTVPDGTRTRISLSGYTIGGKPAGTCAQTPT